MRRFDAPTRPVKPEACDLRVGDTVKFAPGSGWVSEWPGEYRVTGINWHYQGSDELDITIASDEEIRMKYGATSDFKTSDLIKV